MQTAHEIPADAYAMFDARVAKGSPDECWPWQGAKFDSGYGYVYLSGRIFRATHLALIFDGRPRPDDYCALHRCDNPPCCNPAHLWWGTRGENTRDMFSKGRGNPRHPSGEPCRKCGHHRRDDVKNGEYRRCRECVRRAQFTRYHRLKAAALNETQM